MYEQTDGSYDNPFKFNAKELDDDTGLYYYGARYYNPRLSVWYGVDPLAEKMPSWSPYNYTFDNPVRYTDPDGRSPLDIIYLNKDGSINRVVNNNSKYITIVDTDGKGRLLSTYNISGSLFSWNNRNRQIVANVAAYYGKQQGISKIGASYEEFGLAHYDPADKGIWIAPMANGNVSPKFDNKYNLQNALVHENFHKIDDANNVSSTFISHSNVYVKQMTDESFSKTSYDFQAGSVGSLVNHIYSAIMEREEGTKDLVNEFNNGNKSGWKIGSGFRSGYGWPVTYKGVTTYILPKKLSRPED